MADNNIRIRAVERTEIDLRRLARALIDLAIARQQTDGEHLPASSLDTSAEAPGQDEEPGAA